MRAGLLLGLGVITFCGSAYAQGLTKKDTVLQGGPLDKVVLGPLVTAEGKPGFGLKPSEANVSPVPEAMQAAVKGLVNVYESAKTGGYASYLAPNATGTWCEGPLTENCRAPEPFGGMPLGEHCTANTPFFQGGSKVRLEWIYKGQLYYISFLSLSGDKVQSVVTTRASVPPIFNPDAKI